VLEAVVEELVLAERDDERVERGGLEDLRDLVERGLADEVLVAVVLSRS